MFSSRKRFRTALGTFTMILECPKAFLEPPGPSTPSRPPDLFFAIPALEFPTWPPSYTDSPFGCLLPVSSQTSAPTSPDRFAGSRYLKRAREQRAEQRKSKRRASKASSQASSETMSSTPSKEVPSPKAGAIPKDFFYNLIKYLKCDFIRA